MSTPTRTPGPAAALGPLLGAMVLAVAYLAYDLTRFAWTLLVAPLSKAAREARSCRRVQLGYRCHSYLPQGCEACGRHEHRPVTT
jgi:hypothetical protein